MFLLSHQLLNALRGADMGKRLLAGGFHSPLYLALNPRHVVDVFHHGFLLLFSNFSLSFGIDGFFPAFALCCFCIAANRLVFTSPIIIPHPLRRAWNQFLKLRYNVQQDRHFVAEELHGLQEAERIGIHKVASGDLAVLADVVDDHLYELLLI